MSLFKRSFLIILIIFLFSIGGLPSPLKIPANAIWVDSNKNISHQNGTIRRPFRNINNALRYAKPGKTIVIKKGIYRESVELDSINFKKPLTLLGYPGERVLISGMKRLGRWENFKGNIYVTRIDFNPIGLYVNYKPQNIAREPNESWWLASSVDESAIIDEYNLKKMTNAIIGSEAFFWSQHGNIFHTAKIISFDRSEGKIKLNKAKNFQWLKFRNGDKYYLKNHHSYIDKPGEWSAEKKNGKYLIYFWPKKKSDLLLAEVPHINNQIIKIRNSSNIIISGIEVVGGIRNGLEISKSNNIKIKRCVFHNNGNIGLTASYVKNLFITNNISWNNYYGIAMDNSENVIVAENDIAYNNIDGLLITWKSNNIEVKNNYIHNHQLWGHPDNIQIYRDVSKAHFINNLIIAGGQSVMMQETTKGKFVGNMFIGTEAFMMIFGHKSAGDYTIRNNTLAFSGYGVMDLSSNDYRVYENVFITGHGDPLYSIRGVKGYYGDRNLFWNANYITRKHLLVSDRKWHKSLKSFQNISEQDLNSIYADPQFINAPALFKVIDAKKIHLCTQTKLFLRKGTDGFETGDYIEINFDGMKRKVTSVDSDSIKINPGLTEKPIRSWQIANWKNNTDFKLDLRLHKNSPGTRIGKNGKTIGSTIDIQAYKNGDFNNDNIRDIPEIPKELLR